MAAEPPFSNLILSRLLPEDLDLLRPHLHRIELDLRRRLAEPNRPIDKVYFLERGVASTTLSVNHDPPIEIGIIGCEGLANSTVLLGTDRASTDTFMQIAGSGLALDIERLHAAAAKSPSLHRTLLQYVYLFMVQTASTALANGRATISQRLARWLLMAQDRIDGDHLLLTHDFLAIMLGVRRSGVTVALQAHEQRGLVALARGAITILDRDGLLLAANSYYGIPEAEQHRLFGSWKA